MGWEHLYFLVDVRYVTAELGGTYHAYVTHILMVRSCYRNLLGVEKSGIEVRTEVVLNRGELMS